MPVPVLVRPFVRVSTAAAACRHRVAAVGPCAVALQEFKRVAAEKAKEAEELKKRQLAKRAEEAAAAAAKIEVRAPARSAASLC